MPLWKGILLALIEGLTEYLPVSSTGHLIIGGSLLGIPLSAFSKTYIIAIQPGAILAVLALYWKRFVQSFQVYVTLFIAFIPAAVIGLSIGALIDYLLESVVTVGIMLVIGGLVFLFIDKWVNSSEEGSHFPSRKRAFIIGLFQTLALIPGVSRSAATIIGGLTQKLSRKMAAEFSFLLAVPTLFAATGYKLIQYYYVSDHSFSTDEIYILLIGNAVAFGSALVTIRFFIQYLTRHGFKVFGYYRILVGGSILVFWILGYDLTLI